MPVIGKVYYFQTLTNHWVGRVVAVYAPYTVRLAEASWVPDSGRLSEFIAKGKAEHMEVEPVGEVTFNWTAFMPWNHKLFTKAI